MARTYTLKRRAEQQADTRLRIVEAAMGLHGELGPAQTTFSRVAERAGVQRNTLYAHFPDERSLLLACSARSLECDPMPEADAWRAIEDSGARLTAGLSALYAWYGRNADLAGCVLRDAESHPLVREITELRWAPFQRAYEEVLGAGLPPSARAMLRLALGYASWRSLVRDSGLAPDEAVRMLVQAIVSMARGASAQC